MYMLKLCATDAQKFTVWLACNGHFLETVKTQEQKNLGSGGYKLLIAEMFGRIMNLVRQLKQF